MDVAYISALNGSVIKSGADIDPLKDFSEAAREEVGAFKLFM